MYTLAAEYALLPSPLKSLWFAGSSECTDTTLTAHSNRKMSFSNLFSPRPWRNTSRRGLGTRQQADPAALGPGVSSSLNFIYYTCTISTVKNSMLWGYSSSKGSNYYSKQLTTREILLKTQIGLKCGINMNNMKGKYKWRELSGKCNNSIKVTNSAGGQSQLYSTMNI